MTQIFSCHLLFPTCLGTTNYWNIKMEVLQRGGVVLILLAILRLFLKVSLMWKLYLSFWDTSLAFSSMNFGDLSCLNLDFKNHCWRYMDYKIIFQTPIFWLLPGDPESLTSLAISSTIVVTSFLKIRSSTPLAQRF